MTTRAKRSAKSPRIEALVSEDRELLKTLMQEALQAVLDAAMTETVGAGPGERTRALPPQCARLSAAQGRRRLPPGTALALRPAQPQRGRAGPAGVAHALGHALSEAHRLGRSAHRRDLELLQPAAPTPQTSEVDEHARAAQRRDQTPHPSRADLSERRQLPPTSSSALRRSPRGLARRSPLLE